MKRSRRAAPSRTSTIPRTEREEDPGYTVSGPGFYVWREHHSEALQAAAELAGSLSVDQARRLSRGGRATPTDSEAGD